MGFIRKLKRTNYRLIIEAYKLGIDKMKRKLLRVFSLNEKVRFIINEQSK